MLSLKTEYNARKFEKPLSISATGLIENLFNIPGLSARGQVDVPSLQVNGGIKYKFENNNSKLSPLQCELITTGNGDKFGISINYGN